MASCIANRAASFLTPSATRAAPQSTTCKQVLLFTPSYIYSRAVYSSRSPALLSTYPAQLEKSWLGSKASAFAANPLPSVGSITSTRHGVLETHSLCRTALHCRASGSGIVEEVKKKNQENPVIVYSKSWCPYCSQVKGLFKQLGVPAKVIELDEINEEEEVQDALYELTHQATVPNVFIGGKHIGGCDDTMALKRSGKLFELLADAGVNVTSK